MQVLRGIEVTGRHKRNIESVEHVAIRAVTIGGSQRQIPLKCSRAAPGHSGVPKIPHRIWRDGILPSHWGNKSWEPEQILCQTVGDASAVRRDVVGGELNCALRVAGGTVETKLLRNHARATEARVSDAVGRKSRIKVSAVPHRRPPGLQQRVILWSANPPV